MSNVQDNDQGITEASALTSVNAQYLTFSLGEGEYAVDILKIQEIRCYGAVTPIANAPPFLKGVTNLRGVIVPIIDLRVKFQTEDITYDEFTVVVVLNVLKRIIGVVVDGVSDVIFLSLAQMKAAPEFGSALDTKYIRGLGTIDERMIIVIDIEKLMSSRDMELMDVAEYSCE